MRGLRAAIRRCHPGHVLRHRNPFVTLVVTGVLMLVWIVVADMWLFDESFGGSLVLGLLCAGSYVALSLVGLCVNRRRSRGRPAGDGTARTS